MDTFTLCRLACSDMIIKQYFGGVYASNRLPPKRGYYRSFIINLDEDTKPGSHWIGIYFDKEKCYYFCSFGIKPAKRSILKFIKQNSNTLEWNIYTFQGPFSTTCGYFCLYFLHRFSRGKSLNRLLLRDKNYNDEFVISFVEKHFTLSPCHNTFSKCNQSCVSLLESK